MNLQEALQSMKTSGLLPLILQRLQQQGQGNLQRQPQMMKTPPQQPSTFQTPPPPGGGGVPQVKFDPSGAGASMPTPVPQPQPHEAFTGILGLLMSWKNRKQEKQGAEAANIAQNLMDAVSRKDVAKVHEILNDQKSTKVLDKVYKGWLTKTENAMQPDKTDPEVQAFEQGIQNYLKGKSKQQPDMPAQMGGRLIPQAGPQAQLEAAQTSAQLQAAQKDPQRLLGAGAGQLSSEELRKTALYASHLEVDPRELAILDSANQRALVQGYAKVVTEAQKQEAITRRVLSTTAMQVGGRADVAKLSASSREAVAKITGEYRVAAAKIVADAKKAGAKGQDITLKVLEAQKKALTSMKDNANTAYAALMKAGSTEGAAVEKQLMDSYDAQAKSIDQQMDNLKADQDIDEVTKFLMEGGDAPEEDDKEE